MRPINIWPLLILLVIIIFIVIYLRPHG